MKKLLFLLLMSFTAYLSTNGQAFVQIGVDSSVQSYFYGPLYRSSAASSFNHSHYAYLYTAAELSNLPSGALITGVQWQAQAGTGGLTGGGHTFNIHMANTTQVDIPVAGNNYNTEVMNATAVYQSNTYDLPAGGGWIDHPFATPFIYTGGNLKILAEHERNGTATGVINFHFELATGLAGGISSSTNTAGTTFSASYSNRRPNIRISYVVPSGLDLAVQAITSPSAPIGAGTPGQVAITLGNFAADPIFTAAVTYQIDSQPPVTESFSGNILSANSAPFTFATPFTTPNSNFVVKVWVSNINGQGADNNPANDTLQEAICPALPGGTYSIGATAANFLDVEAAIAAMQCGGIAGPVSFLIQPGTYQAAANISNIAGAGVNSISFASINGMATDVLIYHDASSNQQEIINISGTAGVSFNGLTFIRTANPSAGHLIHYQNGSNNATVSACRFIDSSGSTLTTARGIGISASSGVSVIGNLFEGINLGINLTGTGLGNNVLANTFNNFGYRAIFASDQSQLVIDGNLINDFVGTSTVAGGIYTTGNEFLTISNNQIKGNLSRYGIYLGNYNSSESQPSLLYNNVIAGVRAPQLAATAIYNPIYLFASFSATATPPNPVDYVEIVNNTVHVEVNSTSTSTLNALFYATGGSATVPAFGKTLVKNNNLTAIASNVPANFRVLTLSIPGVADSMVFDHNNYFIVNGSNDLFKVNSPAGSFTDLAAWRLNYPQQDSNSVSVDPTMAALTTPVPSAASMNNLGLPIPYVFTDVAGMPRNAITPDIGAYEFEPSALDMGIAQLLSPMQNCGLTNAELVSVEFVNNGQDTVSTFQASLYFNGSLLVNDTINTSIAPGAFSTYTFSQTVNMAVGGAYDIQAIVALVGDGNPLNDTISQTILNPLVSVFPLVQNFEQMSNGVPASFPDGWSTSATGAFVFEITNGPTSSTATGPATDNTLGTPAGKYIFTEASFGVAGDTAFLLSPCLDMSSLNLPVLEYHYHMFGSDITGLMVQADVAGVWQQIDVLTGPQQSTSADPFVMRRALIPAAAEAIRFVVVRGGSFNGDVALDDIRILESPSLDVAVNAVLSPAVSGCGFTANEIVSVQIVNSGQDTLSTVPMAYVLNAGAVVTDTLVQQVLPGDTAVFSFVTPLDLSTPGFYTLQVYASLVGDGDSNNDSISINISSIPLISTLPYAEDFETGGIGWTTGGVNNSWALGVPNNTNIDTAASGTHAWVTNLTGTYNPNENSYIQSPCFDFSNIEGAILELDIMRDSENNWDGSQLYYSIDGGANWTLLGSLNGGISNWYNNQNSNGPMSGQPVWTNRLTAQGWLTAAHSLADLDNQGSVLFRVTFQSDGSVNYEGTGIDNFRVRVPMDPVITFVTEAADSCTVLPRTIQTAVRAFSPLTNVRLHYDTAASSTFVDVAMVFNTTDSLWTATIPAGMPATSVSYFVTVVDSAGLVDTSLVFSYVDDYLQIDAGADTTIVAGDTASLRATGNGIAGSNIVDAMRTGGNGSSGVSFNLRAINAVVMDSLYVPIYGTIGNTASVSVWYQPTPITAAPNVSTAPWVQIVNGAAALVGNTGTAGGAALSAVAIPGNLLIPAGQTYGFFYAVTSGSTVYTTHSAAMVDTFTDGNIVIYTGVGAGFGGTAPTPTIATRSFNGSVGYRSNADVVWTELGGTAVLATTDTLNVAPLATTTYVVTISDSTCSKSDSVTVFVTANNVVDVGVASIISPTNPELNDLTFVEVVIENFGTDPITGFDVAYAIDGVEINANPISGTIQPGDTIHHIFSQNWTPIAGGDVTLCAYVKGATGDVNLNNDTSCVTFMALSVNDLQLVSRIYPNPAKDFVNFEFKAQQGQANLLILDQLGKTLHQELIDLSTAHVWQLSTQTYAAGMYTYRLVVAGQMEHGKFIVGK
ncbi:MAG: T9SS type A sorting domain-containing protein [Sphingobacteriaceae bacterium]|nr:T9SS type A sorting domain-containing protein [Sphingobacteriaceae bacterium]